MKTTSFLGFLALSAASLSAAPAVIFEDAFERPNDVTYFFPAPENTPLRYHNKFSAWTRDGVLSVTYGQRVGTKDSGGMLLTINKVSEVFMFMAQNDVALPITDPAYTTVEQIKTYTLSFDAKIPLGKRVEVSIEPNIYDPATRERGMASRLILASLTGTGEYVTYTLPVSKVPDDVVRTFLQYLRDASLNGQEKLLVGIRWTLLGRSQVWANGDTIQLDNIKLTSGQ
jgi:hypothetical protein